MGDTKKSFLTGRWEAVSSASGALFRPKKDDDGQDWKGYVTQKPDVRVEREPIRKFRSRVGIVAKEVAHPDMPYQESRVLRDDLHPALEWMKDYPLGAIDKEFGDVVMEVADGDEMVDIRRTANALGKRVRNLGYKGGLELLARIGGILEVS